VKSSIYDERNVTMMMDFYELSMAYGYFKNGNRTEKVAFDVFYRENPDNGGFAIFAGLEQIVEYIKGMHFSEEDIDYLKGYDCFDEEFLDYLRSFKFSGNIYSFREGTIMYPGEPVITIVAPLIEAQLVETAILCIFNHQSMVATKARRIVKAAAGRKVSDFGARRAHGVDAATYGARACLIGGVTGTATVSSAQMLGIKAGGTMAHSWVMKFDTELEAFMTYAEVYPNNCVLLVDTYNVLKSGVPNAIKTFDNMKARGIELKNKGIRLDSGDLSYLSKKARKMLDSAGYPDVSIVVSNSLDEYTIKSLLEQEAPIDSFGVGERMITSKSNPVFGGVYKISAVIKDGKLIPKIKVSETVEKITNPGIKEVYRVYDENGCAVADLIANKDDKIDMSKAYRYVDPEKPWKNRYFENCIVKRLQTPIFVDGEYVAEDYSVSEIADYVKNQLDNEIWEEEQRFENPHKHYMDMTPEYYEMKMSLLHEMREDI